MVAESVVVVRTLVQRAPEKHVRIMRQLARQLERIRVPTARASVVWLLGAYHHLLPAVAPDALRLLAAGFRAEVSQVPPRPGPPRVGPAGCAGSRCPPATTPRRTAHRRATLVGGGGGVLGRLVAAASPAGPNPDHKGPSPPPAP